MPESEKQYSPDLRGRFRFGTMTTTYVSSIPLPLKYAVFVESAVNPVVVKSPVLSKE